MFLVEFVVKVVVDVPADASTHDVQQAFLDTVPEALPVGAVHHVEIIDGAVNRDDVPVSSDGLQDAQRAVLRSLQQHGFWSRGCGWVWDSPQKTSAVLDSLVRRGLVRKLGKSYYPAKS